MTSNTVNKDETPKNGCWIKHARWTGIALTFMVSGLIFVISLFVARVERVVAASEHRNEEVMKVQSVRIDQNDQRIRLNSERAVKLETMLDSVKQTVEKIDRKLDMK